MGIRDGDPIRAEIDTFRIGEHGKYVFAYLGDNVGGNSGTSRIVIRKAVNSWESIGDDWCLCPRRNHADFPPTQRWGLFATSGEVIGGIHVPFGLGPLGNMFALVWGNI